MASSSKSVYDKSGRFPENDQENGNAHVQVQHTYKNAREYAQALRPWLSWYQNSTAMQSFSWNMMTCQKMQQFLCYSNCVNGYSPSPWASYPSIQRSTRPDPYASRRPPNFSNGQGQPQTQASAVNQNEPQTDSQENGGVRMKIPTFWKRVAAELIDFTFLFYIKMIISISLVSEFNLDYLTFMNGEELVERLNDLDYDRAFAITFEVIALEIINRVLITIFETMCLCRARARGRGIGATPGKRLMGLKVVSCDSIQPVENGLVMVSPAGNISVKNAFLRSVIKNFTIAFFLPACLTLFFFKHNRAAYDVVAHTVVVEEVA